MLKSSIRNGFKIAKIKRKVKKTKFFENIKIKEKGTNFPVDMDKLHNHREDQTYPPLL